MNLMWLALAGIGIYGFTQGWFSGLLPGAAAGGSSAAGVKSAGPVAGSVSSAATAATAASAPAPPPNSVTTYVGPVAIPVNITSQSSAGPPALGSKVTNLNDVRGQLTANDPYIIPDASTVNNILAGLPSSYYLVNTKDSGTILVRPDVWYQVLLAIPGSSGYTVAGGAAQHTQDPAMLSLSDIQRVMKSSGLNGLGDFRRHMFTRTGRVA